MVSVAVYRPRESGFALLELSIAAVLVLLGAIWFASRLQGDVQDAGAKATASYLLAMRGAAQEMLVQNFDTLAGYPAVPEYAGATPPVPAYLQAALPLNLGVAELMSPRAAGLPGYLPAGFPARPVYGGEARLAVWREGDCPGASCMLHAIVYTTQAIATEAGIDYSPELVGQIMLATQGYGGHAPPGAPERLRGAIFDVANPVGSVVGVVGVSASLDTTLFNQFVRHGETRAVRLRNRLDVAGMISSATGLALDTAVTPGDACASEGAYATSARQTLSMCLTGVWFELVRYVVTGQASDLADGAPLPAVSCPANMQPFLRLGLQALDVTMSGPDVDVQGVLQGSVTASGNVGQSGSVSVSGTFDGTIASSSDSRVRVAQGVGVDGAVVRMTDAGPQARAYAVYGCQYV